jgi:hypothetical protein
LISFGFLRFHSTFFPWLRALGHARAAWLAGRPARLREFEDTGAEFAPAAFALKPKGGTAQEHLFSHARARAGNPRLSGDVA